MEKIGVIIMAVCAVVVIAMAITIAMLINRLKKSEAKIQLMENHASISQIRPHFLYNCLNSIYYLCDENPLLAKDAISNFSEYLRDDLEALSGETTVPFKKELEHIERYVKLEKLRFGDLLNVKYDIKFTDFNLPVLSVQPLVENAIKHGVSKQKDGGTVKISVAKISNQVIISVSDDGEGFDTKVIDYKKPWIDSKGKKHVGMSNVYARIVTLAGGRLSFTSSKQNGTTATINLPYAKCANI